MRQFGQGGVRHRLTAERIGLVTRQEKNQREKKMEKERWTIADLLYYIILLFFLIYESKNINVEEIFKRHK